MKQFLLEVCVDSFESAKNAAEGGADRLELCGNLMIGGTTPSFSLLSQVRKECNKKIHVLIRPRFGDFLYSEEEFIQMCDEIKAVQSLGADGIVIGVLDQFGNLDLERMEKMMEAAKGMSVTFHRAFDVCREPFAVIEQLIKLGVSTLLTSGQAQSAKEGKNLLAALVQRYHEKIEIMAGGGISADGIEDFYADTKITSYHMSGKVKIESKMKYRKQGVNMGLPLLSEYENYITSKEEVRRVKEKLKLLES